MQTSTLSGKQLWTAARRGDLATVRTLLDTGIKPDTHRSYGISALHQACEEGHANIVSELLNHGADVEAQTDGGWTPLHHAASRGHVGIVDKLLEHGARRDVVDKEGRTPKQCAASSDHVDVVEMLGAHRASSDAKDSEGHTPIDVARNAGKAAVVTHLNGSEGKKDGTCAWYSGPKSPTSPTNTQEAKSPGGSISAQAARPKDFNTYINMTNYKATKEPEDVFDTKLWTYRLNFSEPLGNGSFGEVYKARHEDGGDIVALKKLTWNIDISDLPFHPQREIDAYRSVPEHENIVRLLDHKLINRMLIVVMELCDLGHMESYFQKKAPDMDERVDLMLQASTGLLHLHSQRPPIVHRDIKPHNLLLKQEGPRVVLKLADLGLAKVADQTFLGTLAGTLAFIAPDVLPNKNEIVSYTKEVDIFSFGLVLQAMILFKEGDRQMLPVLEGKEDATFYIAREMQEADKKGEPIPAVVIMRDDDNFSISRIKNLIKHMTRFEVNNRIKLSQVHKELNSIKEFLKE